MPLDLELTFFFLAIKVGAYAEPQDKEVLVYNNQKALGLKVHGRAELQQKFLFLSVNHTILGCTM